MSSNSKLDDIESQKANRAPWVRPEFRRLDTKDAEASGHCQDEGNTNCDKDNNHGSGRI